MSTLQVGLDDLRFALSLLIHMTSFTYASFWGVFIHIGISLTAIGTDGKEKSNSALKST